MVTYFQSLGLTVPDGVSYAQMEDIIRTFNATAVEDSKITLEGLKVAAHKSYIYKPITSRYLLPASLVLLCLSIDFKGIINLGPKAIIMFLAATVGVILGGPIALLLISNVAPEGFIPASSDDVWRGLATVAGSWIGGGANQTAMKEIYDVSDNLFATMIIVDVVVANIWMGFLLYGANISDKVDGWLDADSSAIEDLKERMSSYSESIKQMPTLTTTMVLMAVAFGGVAIAHFGADTITGAMSDEFKQSLSDMRLDSLTSHFFWLIVISTTVGLLLSFTKARKLEGVGASRWGSVFIYVLVASIGMKMNLGQVWANLGLFAIGIVWMLVHVSILLVTAKVIKAPFFFVAVGSQANIGGAASAPIVASAFNPSLAPVGVLMAVLGYALGTYGAIICATLMQAVAGG
ncbi:MAG: putative membrane protein [Flavobacteriales bacterium]